MRIVTEVTLDRGDPLVVKCVADYGPEGLLIRSVTVDGEEVELSHEELSSVEYALWRKAEKNHGCSEP